MSRNVYITFSGAPYEATTAEIVKRGPSMGADAVWVYDDRWLIHTEFYRLNRKFWDHPHKRGFGWYIWKPYIIMHALSRLDPGDCVLYTDADTYPLAYFGNLFHICRRDGGIMLFASENHWQHQWCKRDCFITMGMDSQPVAGHLAQAGVARFMVFEKGPWAADQFLMEWLTYCVNSRANTFDPSQYGEERPGFIEHRAEQAIMTNLAYKYGLRLYREACGAGESIDRDRHLYPQLFVQVDVPGEKVSTEPLGSSFADVPYPC